MAGATERWRLERDGGQCFLESFGEPPKFCSVCENPDEPHTQVAVVMHLTEEWEGQLDRFLKRLDRFRGDG